jgi:2-methylcitrate dehydratase PrpD
VARLRALVTLDVDPAVDRDAAALRVSLRPEEWPAVEVAVEHTRGSAARPLTGADLLGKVRALFGPVLGERAADRARDAIGKLPGAEDTSELLAAIRPEVRP